MIVRKRASAAVGAVCLLSVLAAAAAKDPFVGTWKLNVEKSKFEGGTPPKSSVATITTSGDKRRLVVHTVPASGPELTTESTAADDGKDYPMKGSSTVDTVSVIKIDERTLERRDKKNGQVVTTMRATVSGDGKTMTVVQRGAAPQGGTFTNTLVYDRQLQR